KKNDFDGSANENRSVQQNHPEKFRVGDFCPAVGDDLSLMPFGDLQFDDAKRRNRQQQSKKRDDRYCHWSRRNSALKPGPNAPAKARSPGSSGRFSSHSWRINKMVALDRLPTLPR